MAQDSQKQEPACHVDISVGLRNSRPACPSSPEAGFPTQTTRAVTGSEPFTGATSTNWPGVSEMPDCILAPSSETSTVNPSLPSRSLSFSVYTTMAILALLRSDRRTGWLKVATACRLHS